MGAVPIDISIERVVGFPCETVVGIADFLLRPARVVRIGGMYRAVTEGAPANQHRDSIPRSVHRRPGLHAQPAWYHLGRDVVRWRNARGTSPPPEPRPTHKDAEENEGSGSHACTLESKRGGMVWRFRSQGVSPRNQTTPPRAMPNAYLSLQTGASHHGR